MRHFYIGFVGILLLTVMGMAIACDNQLSTTVALSTNTPAPLDTVLTITRTSMPTLTITPSITPTPFTEVISMGVRGIYSGPDTQKYDSLGTVSNGTTGILLAIDRSERPRWYVIQLEDGTVGWVLADRFQIVGDAGTVTAEVVATVPPTPILTSTPTPLPGPVVLKGHTDLVNVLDFSPNGMVLASGGSDNTIRLWNVTTGKEIAMLDVSKKHPDLDQWWQTTPGGIAFNPDGKSLIAHIGLWGAGATLILSFEPLEETSFLDTGGWSGFTVSPDAKTAAITGCFGEPFLSGTTLFCNGAIIEIVDLGTGEKISQSAAIVNRDAWGMAFSPDGSRLAVACGDGTLWLLNVTDMSHSALWESSTPLLGVTFSPDGSLLAVAAGEGGVSIFDIENGKKISTIYDGAAVISVAFGPNGKRIASGNINGVVRLWDLETGKQLAELSGHSDTVVALAFSPNGTWLASGSYDKTIRLWPVTP